MTQNSDKTKEKIDEFVYIKIKTSKWCQKKKERERERRKRQKKENTKTGKKTTGKIFISQRANLPIIE